MSNQVLILLIMLVAHLFLTGFKICCSSRKDLRKQVLTAFLSEEQTWTNPAHLFKITGNYFAFSLEWSSASLSSDFASRS